LASHVAVRFPTSSVRRHHAADRDRHAVAPDARVRHLSRRRQQSRAVQEATLAQALRTSRNDARIEFTIEDTTSLHGDELHTDEYTIAGGGIGHVRRDEAHAMSDERNLARFVARTLDDAEASGARQTWIDLVDHGGGDGGGLQTSDGRCMSMPDIAKAISDGVALHASAHPEDAGRGIDGVVANQCLMDTMGLRRN
jgi:hypothetical protein